MNVLVVAAHADDEVLGCGATIAKHRKAGDSVTVCIAAYRVYNHIHDTSEIMTQQRETHDAASILQYHDIQFFGLKDEHLDECLVNIIIPLEECINKVRPAVVYTHHSGDINQDHRAVHHATMICCRSTAKHHVARLLTYEVPSSTDIAPTNITFQPNFYVNVESHLTQKIQALECYNREVREFPHPRSSTGLTVLAAKRGMECGFMQAEAFMLLRDEWA